MKKISRISLFVALTLILLTAACAEATPTTIVMPTDPGDGTDSPPSLGTDITGSPVGTLDTTAAAETATIPAETDVAQTPGTDTTQTAEVSDTEVELILLECQFCIEDVAHALLVLSDTTTYETVASTSGTDTGCNTVDTYNGRQVILCRSQENTSINLNICTDGTNCTQLLVELQDCPDVVQPGAAATSTLEIAVPTNTGEVGVTDTPDPLANPTATP